MTAVIHCGDALEVLAAQPEASVDALITDPPYCSGSVSEASRTKGSGQGLRSETIKKLGWFVGDNMGTAGLSWLLRATAVIARRVVKPTGHFACFCDWRMFASLQPAIESAGWRFQNLVVWDKGSMGLGLGFRAQHELCLHFTNGAPEYHDMGTSNVLDVGRVPRDEREHQTQKPVELMSALVRVLSPVGGVVFDPYAGSGSTGVAAVRLGRDFVGVEHDEEHAKHARERIAAEIDGITVQASRAGQVALFAKGAA